MLHDTSSDNSGDGSGVRFRVGLTSVWGEFSRWFGIGLTLVLESNLGMFLTLFMLFLGLAIILTLFWS